MNETSQPLPLPSADRADICRGRSGMSLMEVIVAIAILSVTLSGVVGLIGNQSVNMQQADYRRLASDVAQSLSLRIRTARWEWLGTDRLPWSYGRYVDGSGHPAMRYNALAHGLSADDDLVTTGVVPADLQIRNLHLWVEWYRAVDATDSAGIPVAGEDGLFDEGATSSKAFRAFTVVDPSDPFSSIQTRFRPSLDGTAWNPAGTTALANSVVDGHPLAARLVLAWGEPEDRNGDGDFDDPRELSERLELYIARTP